MPYIIELQPGTYAGSIIAVGSEFHVSMRVSMMDQATRLNWLEDAEVVLNSLRKQDQYANAKWVDVTTKVVVKEAKEGDDWQIPYDTLLRIQGAIPDVRDDVDVIGLEEIEAVLLAAMHTDDFEEVRK